MVTIYTTNFNCCYFRSINNLIILFEKIFIGILITYIFHLNEKGLQVLGKFEGKFPVPTVPPLTLLKFQDLFEPAMIIAIIGFIEVIFFFNNK